MKLWYTAPADGYLEGLPIGTGRLAAMVLGGITQERVALNHEWLWKGVNRERDTEVRSHLLPEVRRLLLDGQYEEGTLKANEAFGCHGDRSGLPNRVDPYQPAGDLYLEFDHGSVRDYTRALDLETARATVSYDVGGGRLTREYLAHLVEDLILVRVTHNDVPFNCTAWLGRTHDDDCTLTFDADEQLLTMQGDIRNGVDFQVNTQAWCRGGQVRILEGRKLAFEGVTEIVLAVNIGVTARETSARTECSTRSRPFPLAWDALFRAHVGEHERHYGSMKLDLALDEPALPTDERIRLLREGHPDPGLCLLYFHFGRYLLCASSANASLPANLQGKWNQDLHPPWESDYHHDVNLQMNYWIAEPAGMQSYVEALLQHVERFVPHARKVAMDLYGCKGVVYPIQTDAWGRATPESFGWAVWIGAAPWLAQHLWWHYEYGLDRDYLRDRAYPFFKEVAAFYEDYLIEDGNGALQIVPSQSPENRFVGAETLPVSLCVSATMDVILAREALNYAIRSAEILDVDAEKRQQWRSMSDRLPALQIGKHGQLQEWNEDFEEAEPAHRHVSHLIGLYPGDALDPETTPELWRAAEIALERRLAAGGGHTGWSRAWMACLFARLRRPEDAWEHLNCLIKDFATNSLLDLHPPEIFQIEGNLGGAAAVIEMLLQSYHGELHFLPALPAAWPEGRVSGLRARGGLCVGMQWRAGQWVSATITGEKAQTCTILHAPRHCEVKDAAGKPVPIIRNGHQLRFALTPGQAYELSVPAD